MQIIDSFETGFYRWHDEGEITVPNGWLPGWREVGDLKRPEYKPDATPIHVFDGSVSAKMTHRFTKFDGVLYRVFSNIQPGGRVDAFAHFKAFTEPKGGLAGRIGIDPTGGTDFTGGDVLWGDWWGQYQGDWANDKWHQLSATAMAQNTAVTVFLHARQDYAVNVTAAHWDAFILNAAGTEPEPPLPPPGGEFDWERLARAHEAFAAVARGAS